MVICLDQGADLHMAQLMRLPLTVSCFSKIQIGFTFLVPAHTRVVLEKGPLNGCVCVCVFAMYGLTDEYDYVDRLAYFWRSRTQPLSLANDDTSIVQSAVSHTAVPFLYSSEQLTSVASPYYQTTQQTRVHFTHTYSASQLQHRHRSARVPPAAADSQTPHSTSMYGRRC